MIMVMKGGEGYFDQQRMTYLLNDHYDYDQRSINEVVGTERDGKCQESHKKLSDMSGDNKDGTDDLLLLLTQVLWRLSSRFTR